MNPARRRKITILILSLSVLFIAAALVLYALRQNISLFYTPTQAITGEAPKQRSIRMGGMVEKGSIIRAKKGLAVQFKISDLQQSITVIYTGILPDLFREGQGVVAEGQLVDNQHFRATQVLAKHDENYMPPEVKYALNLKKTVESTTSGYCTDCPRDFSDFLSHRIGDTPSVKNHQNLLGNQHINHSRDDSTAFFRLNLKKAETKFKDAPHDR